MPGRWQQHTEDDQLWRGSGVRLHEITADVALDRRGKSITTFVVYDASRELRRLDEGQILELATDAFEPFEADIAAWCEAVGHRLISCEPELDGFRFLIKKGEEKEIDTSLSMVISDAGLLELLSPLGFAMAAALEGIQVHIYFQGPAVKVLARGFRARLHGWSRLFTRFAEKGLIRTGHVPAQEKLRQLRTLDARFYVCGPSMQHYKVDKEDLVFEDLPIVEYLSFMSVMKDSEIQLFV